MEEYIKIGWPKYQDYQEEDWFEEEAYYCPEHDVYFIPLKFAKDEEFQ